METPFPHKFWSSQHSIHGINYFCFSFAFNFEKQEKWPFQADMKEQLQLFIENNSEEFHFSQPKFRLFLLLLLFLLLSFSEIVKK